MRLDLSILADRRIEYVGACGVIQSPQTLGVEVTEDQKCFHVFEETEFGPVWLRLLTNTQSRPEGIHFHLDFARESYFDDGTPSRDNSGGNDFYDHLEHFRDQRIDFVSRPRFVLPRPELRKDSVINLLLSISVGPDESGARLSGSKYSLNSGSVSEMTWHLRKRDSQEFIVANLKAYESVELDEMVLPTILGPSSQVFRTLILEEGVA